MDESPYRNADQDQDNDYPDNVIRLLRQRVKYVFVIYQENRSFDSYCGTFPGAEGLFNDPASQSPRMLHKWKSFCLRILREPKIHFGMATEGSG